MSNPVGETKMPITIGTNIAALRAARELSAKTERLGTIAQQLSTGLRITKAGDDSASLSIANSLTADTRVYNQGIRNLSDGISLLTVAEGSLQALSSITTRITELAEQAANGTLTSAQRSALDTEGRKLVDEYNRIIESTSFNDIHMFASVPTTITLQDGYGSEGSLQFSIGDHLSSTTSQAGALVGDGTFGSATSFGFASSQTQVSFVDINNDGHLDAVTSVYEGTITTALGNGDGTFQSFVMAPVVNGNPKWSPIIGDFLGSTAKDLIYFDEFGNMYISEGNGGSSWGATSLVTPAAFGNMSAYNGLAYASDLNGDGKDDFIASGNGGTFVMHNNGTGTFTNAQSVAGTLAVFGDFNSDNRVDFAVGTSVYTGQASGLFSASGSIGSISGGTTGDFNADGLVDIISGGNLFYGNGNGTFTAATGFTLTTTGVGSSPVSNLAAGDFDGDGYDDVVRGYSYGTPSEYIQIFLNNRSGGFTTGQLITIFHTNSLAVGDLNEDGVLDIGSSRGAELFLGNGTASSQAVGTNYIDYVDLTTQGSASSALTTMRAQQTKISNEAGAIGAFQSRISAAQNVLTARTLEMQSALSRILDVDVATQAAEMTRLIISQSVATSVIANINSDAQLVMLLLD
jgi:flagellin